MKAAKVKIDILDYVLHEIKVLNELYSLQENNSLISTNELRSKIEVLTELSNKINKLRSIYDASIIYEEKETTNS